MFVRCRPPKVPIIYQPEQKFEIGKVSRATRVPMSRLRDRIDGGRSDPLVAGVGSGEGISARVVDLHTIKPLDREAIERAAAENRGHRGREEHLVDSGLGVRVAQVVAETNPCLMEFVGIQNTYAESGSPEALLEKYGLTSTKITEAIRRVLSRKR